MAYLIDKEINGLKSDIEMKNIALEAEKEAFANKILNGLGEKIKADLSKPVDKKEIRKLKRARNLKILKENLKKIL